LSEFLNIKIRNPRSLLHARTIAIPDFCKKPFRQCIMSFSLSKYLLGEYGIEASVIPGSAYDTFLQHVLVKASFWHQHEWCSPY
jgi:hypothetical protein